MSGGQTSELEQFIVAAKAATYVGSGAPAAPSRPGSHDLGYQRGRWRYLDSYFGAADFHGQEAVWHEGTPVWAMSYYGYIVRPDLIDAARAGATIKAALSEMYRQGRFLGGFDVPGPYGRYVDSSEGGYEHFRGREQILVDDVEAYALDYFGGLVRP